MTQWGLWLRWSWRDLRQRWLQVTAVALIIALGTGVYSGLISTSPWRQMSNDASYARLNMYDLRLSLTTGSFLDEDSLMQAIRNVPHAAWITGIEPRLIVPTLVDASTDTQTIIVPGRVIGAGWHTDSTTPINDVYITSGRDITAGDTDQPVAVLEHNFATYYRLPSAGTLRLSGSRAVQYVGTGLAPEYFVVFTEEGGMMAQANFAAVFVPLKTAQTLAERPGKINDVLFTLSDDANADTVPAELEAAVKGLASVGVSFMTPKDDQAFNMLYEDIHNDEVFWRWMAYLFMAGAVFGAFSLATRLVESQRREIGIQMALGVPTIRIALRPLLVAAQIAVLGAALGMIIGLLAGNAFGQVLQNMLPLPVFTMPFQPRIFLEAAALGVILPLLATIVPVAHAVRVEPIDAIKTGHLVAKGGGFAPLLTRRAASGHVLTHMPLRNVLRAPRRAALTLLGIAAAVALLILIMSALDSFRATLDRARAELLQANPQRMVVQFNFFYPESFPSVSAIAASPLIGAAEPSLQLGGYLKHEGQMVETLLEMVNMSSSVWRPSVIRGAYPGEFPGVLLADKAARDLGVEPGDTITLRHPRRTGLLSYDWTETEVVVSGIHPLPLRFQTYMDIRQADLIGLRGVMNAMHVIPASGASQDDVKRALFDQSGVASVQPVSALITVFENLIGEFVDIFAVMQGAGIVLALLIAYNSTSISLDERAREMATLFAFGVRIRTALRLSAVENVITSLAGTLAGSVLGVIALVFMLTRLLPTLMPDITLSIAIFPLTVVAAVLVGVGVAVLAPVLNARKLTHMDIPAMLRVME